MMNIRRYVQPSGASIRRASPFSTSTHRGNGYDATIPNLRIGAHTRVIFQGFTGRQATANARESIDWGTNIVGGVTPGKSGEHLGLPVLPTVREAMRTLKPDATGIYVAAHQAAAAIEESIEAEVPLIVAVAEHIPIHDIMRIHSILKTQSKSRLVGANAPGIISAIGKCRIGFQPLPVFTPGVIGIVAKSGTLGYEAVASTTRSGLGQSLCIGVGGDIIAGTNFVDALKIFEQDDSTDGIILIGEIGGSTELDAAAWIKDYTSRSHHPKPISAIIAGIHNAPGRVMGHAGAFLLPGDPDPLTKIKYLEDAGVTIVNHPAKLGDSMKSLLGHRTKVSAADGRNKGLQRRELHSLRTVRPTSLKHSWKSGCSIFHRRYFYLEKGSALALLRQEGVRIAKQTEPGEGGCLAVTVDRRHRCPCITACPSSSAGGPHLKARNFLFDYRQGIGVSGVADIAEHLGLGSDATKSLSKLLNSLVSIYMEREAFLLEAFFVERNGNLEVFSARAGFDDAALKVKRQADTHALREIENEDPQELEAEKDGIVYIKLTGNGEIGTLVNGAGLAMNTVDALADAGGSAANFLDTGGKATSETVKKSFQLILQDGRVKVIFVNIFGGLTLGDMIARGILLAFKELDMKLPVIVRIRGTNEKEGRKIIDESGLPLHAFDDFDEAAAKAIELAGRSEDALVTSTKV